MASSFKIYPAYLKRDSFQGFEDGNISCLTRINTLKGVYFKDRKSYDAKLRDFNNYDYICTPIDIS